ncbi:putative bifunctional diguanylate cyclase/phosphodiesterase [Clostridium cibarium]|uniref:EAL domain-containing protein n=1 Tax=Clostridium cibarium TaxID=2762247 RepID=A0ABR8PX94_9CLOT|nr:EAL domain-containing protein [Clostridium cibarium]MBD7912759.1 EAL domain-containing protein [Clostridium cibarium]
MNRIENYNIKNIIGYSKDNFLVIHIEKRTIEVSGNLVMRMNNKYTLELTFEKAISLIRNEDLKKVKDGFYDGVASKKPIELDFYIYSGRWEQLCVSLKIKPFINKQEIVEYFYGYIHDISLERKAEESLKSLMEFDPLTKLPSTYYIKDYINEYLLYRKKDNFRGILLLINIDNFKVINDSFGYDQGNLLLVEVANQLLNIIEKEELISRYSGDEFIIFKPQINEIDEAKEVVNKIKSIFNKPFNIKGCNMYITASIGVAVFPENGDSFNDLLKSADLAMYRVKSNGKDGYELFDANMNPKTIDRVYLIQKELKNALLKEELYVVFQPKVVLDNSTVTGFEALIRWENNSLGFIGPSEFVSIAEDTRLIIPIGRFVLEEVFKKIKTLLNEGFDEFKVAVNFSEVQFRYGTIIDDFIEFSEKYKVSPQYIEVEITESILMKSFDDNINKLQAIRSLGATVALDDFGTGYSCLNYLTKLPIDVLKIDRSFVIDLLENYKSRCVVENIINLSHALGIDVVAEGVEEIEQVEYLKKVLCDIVQGYYFSKPKRFECAKKLLGKKL